MTNATQLFISHLPSKGIVAMLLSALLASSACVPQPTPDTNTPSPNIIPSETENVAEIILPSVFEADGVSAFLAARQAIFENDISSASQFFQRTIQTDSETPFVLKRSFMAHYQNGDL